jgi:hypothetical protein
VISIINSTIILLFMEYGGQNKHFNFVAFSFFQSPEESFGKHIFEDLCLMSSIKQFTYFLCNSHSKIRFLFLSV